MGRYIHDSFISGDPCEFTNTPHATYMPSPLRELSQERRHENDFVGTIRILVYYVEAPQAWFCNINAKFAVSSVTKPLTKFHRRSLSCRRRWFTPSARSATTPASSTTHTPSYSELCCAHTASVSTRGSSNGWTIPALGQTNHQS
jgi:hypothetical protein